MITKKTWGYVAGVGILIIFSFFLFSGKSLPIKKDAWQAVFLTNNQVYFGKLSEFNDEYFKLIKVFYLQSDQSVNEEQKEITDLNLIKLGAEIHGPEDAMYISKKQIIFWENLKPDSRIVKIISEYK